jgi:hypothetical protein
MIHQERASTVGLGSNKYAAVLRLSSRTDYSGLLST